MPIKEHCNYIKMYVLNWASGTASEGGNGKPSLSTVYQENPGIDLTACNYKSIEMKAMSNESCESTANGQSTRVAYLIDGRSSGEGRASAVKAWLHPWKTLQAYTVQ